MEVRYRRELNTAYMILPATGECEEYARRIQQENRLEGIMPLSVRRMNGANEYYFDITDGRSLSRILERRTVTLDEIRQLLESLNRVTEHMEDYLMNVNHLVLDPELIYLKADGANGKKIGEADFSRGRFCCHPAWEKDLSEQIRELMQYFLNKMDHMDTGSVEIAYDLFQATQKEYFSMNELLELCQCIPEENREINNREVPENTGEESADSEYSEASLEYGKAERRNILPMSGNVLWILPLILGSIVVGGLIWFLFFGI